jgi:DNA-binding LacI/PurR family transcriptional regulator
LKQLQSGRVSTKRSRASVRAIAERLSLSPATVSRALNNHPQVAAETRVRILEAADTLGYVHHAGRTCANVVGLVYPTDPVRPEYGNFESAMLSGILRGVNERRFDVAFINVERDKSPEESYTQFFRRKGVRGVIVRTIAPVPDLAEAIAQEGFPCVLVADRTDEPSVSFVCSDSKLDSIRAVEHLINLGHRRIALGVHAVMDSDHQDRRDGYQAGLRRHAIGLDEDLVVSVVASMQGGGFAIDRLLSLDDPPTAVYFTDPLATVGALHRCLELGVSVPQELSIVGFDDSDVRYRTFPSYTAVCQDAAQLGLEAARWLTRFVDGMAEGPFRVHRPTSFSYNQSTGPCPETPVRLARAGHAILRSEERAGAVRPAVATEGGVPPRPAGTETER